MCFTEVVEKNDETWAAWKTFLIVGAVGFVLLLIGIGIFIGFLLKQSSGGKHPIAFYLIDIAQVVVRALVFNLDLY